ncbi:MAG TPA: TonB-dependent receptor [Bacteroidales bacterium]|nr:TonB-dependent receptor [Bacteroidales bacterium]
MKSFSFYFLIFFSLSLFAQENASLSGYVRDANSGEELIGANLSISPGNSVGGVTNLYGFYSISLKPGSYNIEVSYTGYENFNFQIEIKRDTTFNIELYPGYTMEEVVVKSESEDQNVNSTKMGTVTLPIEEIKKLPALMGEVDVLRSLQLLPGVMSATEGSTGFFVRGGAADQNLVLLDDAVVYNPGHLLGFFSVFNADALKNTTLIKGSLPAKYGGRLSSVVDIQMKEGNNKKWAAQGGIGLISSRFALEGPIIKDKASFIISARRTYALDLAQPFLNGGNFEGTNYYFYDLNAKVNYRFSDKDRLYLSGYFGRDVFRFRSASQDFQFDLPYGNSTATLRWNHLFSDKLFMNISAIYNDYEFNFEGGQENFRAELFSGIRDYQLKADFDYYPSNNHFIRFGATYTRHRLQPQLITATTGEVDFSNDLLTKYGGEYALYIQDEYRVNTRLSINGGLRLSFFSQFGPYASPVDGRLYSSGEHVKTYFTPEPRVSFRYKLTDRSSIKGGIAYTAQYLHLVSNSTSTLPIDIWVPSTELVKPQRGIQYSLGYFQNLRSNTYEFSAEVYYRDLYNQIDYRDDYVNNPNNDVELDFVFGKGRAYGLELLAKKKKGDFTGWLSYTLSRTERSFTDIEDGRWYPAFYDRTHDLSLVGMYTINDKWEFNGTFIFGTGNAYTPVAGAYSIENRVNVFYGPRNSDRLIPYHRFDLSFTYTRRPNAKGRFSSSWNFSIYNAYNRMNPTFIYNSFDTDSESATIDSKAIRVALFPIIPSVTWNFKWNQE